jgi:CRISPR/Cas system-associated exonuclease Cas4 (RecB family)
MVAATAWDIVGVVSVEFLLDGAPLGAADLAAPYQVMWPPATAANGTHTITAVARDAMGHATTATSISVTVANDSTAPTVVLTSPAAASIVDDEWEMVAATASDNVGVVSVEFLVDGTPLGAADLFAPYSVWWRAKDSGDGVHTLTAVARDAAGNATSTTVSVVVD